ncbi:MAG: hypothetical protein Q9224_003010 [Gallowayella concinna]
MLQQNRIQLIDGVQKLYDRLISGEPWPGRPLEPSANGQPLTHDVLERLDSIHVEGPVKVARFYESPTKMLQGLHEEDNKIIKRQWSAGTPDSNSTADYSSPSGAVSPEGSVAHAAKKASPPRPLTPEESQSCHVWDNDAPWDDSPTLFSSAGPILPEVGIPQPQPPGWHQQYVTDDSPTAFNNASPIPEFPGGWLGDYGFVHPELMSQHGAQYAMG